LRFFSKKSKPAGDSSDLDVMISEEDELRITPTGHVATSIENAETVYSLNKKETEALMRSITMSRENQNQHSCQGSCRCKGSVRLYCPFGKYRSVFRGRYQRDGYAVEMHALQGEGEYVVPLLVFVPHGIDSAPAVIYLHPEGKITDAQPGGKIEELVNKGYIVAAPDVIGIGEVSDDNIHRSNFLSILIGRSVVGIQAGDINRVVSFLNERGDVNSAKIGAIAFGQMGPSLLHAAAFNQAISSVTLVRSLVSYRAVVNNELYEREFLNYYVGGALTAYDLPDLIATIAPRKIALVELRDQLMQSVSEEYLDNELAFPISIYSQKESPWNIEIVPTTDNINSIIDWGFK
jgi:hypothetical protein